MERPRGREGIVLAGVTYAVARTLGEGPAHRTLLLRESSGHLVARVARPAAAAAFVARLPLLARIPAPTPAGLTGFFASSDAPPEPFVLRRFVDGLRIDEVEDRFLPSSRPPAEVAAFLRRLCAPVQALHAAGLAHGRLHPGNVFIGAGESPLVVDAIIAVPDPSDRGPSANAKAALYAAPEITAGGEPTPRADVHSLGLLAACVLAGRSGAAVVRSLAAEPSAECAIRLGFSPECAAVLARALSREHAARFQDADEFAAAMAGAVHAPAEQPRRPRPGSDPTPRRIPPWAIAAAAALGAFAIGRVTAPAPHPPVEQDPQSRRPTPAVTPIPTRTPRPSPVPSPTPVRHAATPAPTPTPPPPPPELQRGIRSRWFAFDPARVSAGADPWGAEFFRCDALLPAIDFDFGEAAPFNLPPDNFAFTAEAYLYIPVPGRYHFIASVDDGCSFSIGPEVVGDPAAAGERVLTLELMMDEGLVPFAFTYSERTGPAHAHLDWVRPDGVRERIPPSAFHCPPSNTPARLADAWQSMWDRMGEGQRTRIRTSRADSLHGLPAERDGVETLPAPLLPVSLPFATDFRKLKGDLPAPWRVVRRDAPRLDATGRSGGLVLTLVPDDSAGPATDMSNLVGIRLDGDKRRFTARIKMRFPNVAPNQRFQQAGLLLAEDWHGIPDQNNFIRVAYGYEDRSVVTRLVERDGAIRETRSAGVVDPGNSWFWLAIQRHGENYGAFASSDGVNWVSVMEFAAPHAVEHVGIYAIRGGPGASLQVEVESFAISPELEIRPEMPPR